MLLSSCMVWNLTAASKAARSRRTTWRSVYVFTLKVPLPCCLRFVLETRGLCFAGVGSLVQHPCLLVIPEEEHLTCRTSGVPVLQHAERGSLPDVLHVVLLLALHAEHEVRPEANRTRALEVSDRDPASFFVRLAFRGC